MNPVSFLITKLTGIIFWIILISVILSWLVAFRVVDIHNPVVRKIYDFFNGITEYMYRPIRKIMPTVFGGVDISPVIVLVILQLVNYTLYWLYAHYGI